MKPLSTIYRGYRLDGGCSVYVEQSDGMLRVLSPAPSQRIRNHSPCGFEWGYGGSAPAQLALAILLDFTGDAAIAQRWYQDFKWAWICRQQADEIQISGATIAALLLDKGIDQSALKRGVEDHQ